MHEKSTENIRSAQKMIHLGYETGTGKPIAIPLAHMAITGLTQQSGKTTTLEALIDRGELRAVVFVTKPGEKSFTEGRRILPFFKEHADWEYVKELLEARRAESLSKWDGYLMRVCSRARTLQDVRKNVEKELPKKKSARPSHYEILAGYLDLIIPELDRVPYTDKLDLQPGVNIMGLESMSDEMQSMVIRSTIEQIHKREKHTVLVLPEAWKFIPEGGRSAVFQALQTLVREGATNGNFVWLDAQDLAVVSKRILKSVSVWVLGKQQEANEVARTINHLIEPLRIRPDMIKSLGIGQFLVCADSLPARRVYVQPRWLGELDALAIARGEESVETAQAIWRQKLREIKRNEKSNSVLPATGSGFPKDQMRVSPTVSAPHDHNKSGNGNDGNTAGSDSVETNDKEHNKNRADFGRGEIEDPMWKERAEKAEAEIGILQTEIKSLQSKLKRLDEHDQKASERCTMADKQFFSLPEAARKLGLSTDLMRRQYRKGVIPATILTPGGQPRFSNECIEGIRRDGWPQQMPVDADKTAESKHATNLPPLPVSSESDGESESETDLVQRNEKLQHVNYFTLEPSEIAIHRRALLVTAGLDPGDAPPNCGPTVILANDPAAAADGVRNFSYDMNQIYIAIKVRAMQDPEVLAVLARRPELRLKIEPKVLDLDGDSLRGGLALMIHKGFFCEPRNGNVAYNELKRMGRKTARPNVYRELDNLAEMGFLTKEPDGFLATDLKITVNG